MTPNQSPELKTLKQPPRCRELDRVRKANQHVLQRIERKKETFLWLFKEDNDACVAQTRLKEMLVLSSRVLTGEDGLAHFTTLLNANQLKIELRRILIANEDTSMKPKLLVVFHCL